jgi:hypothetical protein
VKQGKEDEGHLLSSGPFVRAFLFFRASFAAAASRKMYQIWYQKEITRFAPKTRKMFPSPSRAQTKGSDFMKFWVQIRDDFWYQIWYISGLTVERRHN